MYRSRVQSFTDWILKKFDICDKPTKRNGNLTRNESLVSTLKQNKDYSGYRELINKIIAGVKKKIGVSITYADFDHMVWYYFKGSKSKIISAMEHLPDKN